jgi:hemoglobin-like flavoprotein
VRTYAAPQKEDDMSLDVELLRSSFDTVVEREPELAHRFYDTLFERHPQARALFRRNTRSEQEKMLTSALVAVMAHLDDAAWLRDTLLGLGAKHESYGVTPEMYGWVGGSLLATLKDICGGAWTPALERAWTQAYGVIAETMQEGARVARAS